MISLAASWGQFTNEEWGKNYLSKKSSKTAHEYFAGIFDVQYKILLV
jgi:hypothetical protein